MENIADCMKRVWTCEQEILNVIHKVCIENNLRYSLMYGTLLGAVRHGGFIPWDDDIDIMMPREDYEKLIDIWAEVAPKGYLLQNKRTDSDFTQNFTKIRKDNTTFIQDEVEKTKKYHTGFFVDIFPADKVAPRGVKRKYQYIASAFNLLTARGYSSGSKGVIGLVEKIVLALPQTVQLKIYEKTEEIIALWKMDDKACWYSSSTIKDCKRYFDSDVFEDMKLIKFNETEYYCVKHTNKVLTQYYGNYMQYPPIEEQVWTHHPIIVNFEHNYEELQEILYRNKEV